MSNQERIVLVLLSIVYVFMGRYIEHPDMQTLGIMGCFGLFQFIYGIYVWIRKGNQFLSPYIIFLLALYIFSFGQSFLWAFGIDPERSLIGFQRITIAEVFDAQVRTLLMLAFFQIGASFASSKTNFNDRTSVDKSNKLKQVGWALFAISIIPYSVETYRNMIISMTSGYAALYEGTARIGVSNWASILADYCIPSLICLFIAYRHNRLVRRSITLFFLLNIIAILITGGRTFAVILLALLVVLYNYLVKKFTKKWLLIGCLGGFCFLQILSYVAEVRVDSNRSLSASSVELESNGAIDAIAEMGSSMFCLIKTTNLVPETTDFRYGKSYLYAFTSLIPNLGFWDIHPAKREANLSHWLTNSLGLDYGTGFSMCAEAYANFGDFGFIIFFFWGLFIAHIFGKIEISVIEKDYSMLAFLLILFWFCLTLPRNNFINLVRPLFFIAGPVYLYCAKFKG